MSDAHNEQVIIQSLMIINLTHPIQIAIKVYESKEKNQNQLQTS
jgi:hypothetical protein